MHNSPQKHIVFAHANGFPAGCYRSLFEIWRAAGWQVHAPEMLGHNPRYPITNNWPHLRDELLDFISQQVLPQRASTEPLMLVGHSLGGILALQAACKRPGMFDGLLMLDAPVVAGWRAQGLRLAKATGLVRHISPGKVSVRRRQEWSNRDDVLKHFASKSAFASWAPHVLQDYVQSGFEPEQGKVHLKFRRDVETRIYDTLPHHLLTKLRRHPPNCPIAFIAATHSTEMRMTGERTVRALAHQRLQWFEGSHLFPFERPEECARAVLEQLQQLQDLGPGACAKPQGTAI
ncbi:alpha/beta fold hydrolase [Roseateles sp. BYS180W]|uniref:Alpha/beta fold hydrolase n=1 Tax=Roseateles rivi TaxID=3299028 RepID=A0ABW7FVD8_9BURK